MTPFIQLQTTLPSEEAAHNLAEALLADRLAACVQIVGPVRSLYHWQGKVESSAEWLCLLKSRASLFETLERRIREIHPYECPELIAAPIQRSSAAYEAWMQGELADASPDIHGD